MNGLGLITGLLAVALLVGCVPLGGATIGSGKVVTREEAITGFDRVDISDSFEADIRQGDTFRVAVQADDNLIRYLRVMKRGSTLEIGLRPGLRLNIGGATRRAEVTLPVLSGLELSGASQATLAGFTSTDPLELNVSGGSGLRGDVEAGDIRLEASGSSQVTLSGSGRALSLEASGASTIDLAGLAVTDATVDASGASRVMVNASGRLDANASGASQISYVGDPTLDVSTSGSSSVSPAR